MCAIVHIGKICSNAVQDQFSIGDYESELDQFRVAEQKGCAYLAKRTLSFGLVERLTFPLKPVQYA